MALDKDQIIALLGDGLADNVVANAIGCEPGYISQIWADDGNREKILALRTKNLRAATDRDRNIDTIEDKLIDKVNEAVDNNLIFKPAELLRAFAMVNAAKRRGVQADVQAHAPTTVVQLTLPVQVVQKFIISKDNEVVALENQTLIPMPANQLLTALAGRDGDSNERYGKVQRFLKPTIEQGLTGKLTDA